MKLIRLALMLGTAIVPAQSYAQESGAAQGGGQAQAGESDAGFQDIVVTARKRSESLQDVPIAVTSIGTDALKAASIRDPEGLTLAVPGITVTNQSGAAQPFIRGIGAIAGDPGFEPAVATYVDGVYIPSNYGSKVSFADIERVEVLKGPQGTLFGRNSVGGLINITTRTPKYDFSGSVRLAYSNYDTLEGDFYATGGLSDKIAASISYSFFDRNKGPGVNVITGKPTYTGEDRSVRGKILFEPSESTRITVAADYRKLNTQDGVDYNLFDFPGNVAIDTVTGPLPNFYDGIAESQLRMSTWGVSMKIEQEFDAFDLMSLTSYRHEKDFHQRDLDLTPAILADFAWFPKYRTFTEELQFNSKADSSIKWVAGLFFLKDKTGYRPGGGFRIFGPVIGANTEFTNVYNTTSVAAFAEATVPLGEKTNVTVGGRYTMDKRKIAGETILYPLDPLNPLGAGDPVPAPLLVIPNPSNKKTFKTPTWRVILDHEIAPRNMVYASYSRGFKAGNFSDTDTTQIYLPEKLDAFEAGYKGDISPFLRANLAAFYYKYKDLQVTFFTTAGAKASNAASSTIYGGELEIDIIPTSNFTIHGGFAYLHAKFDDYPGATCVSPNEVAPGVFAGLAQTPCQAGGNYMTRSPKFTATIQPQLKIPSEIGDFDLSATYFHSASYFADVGNFKGQKPLDLLSARIAWKSANTPITIAAFGANLTNKKYWNFANPAFSGYYYSAAMPRTYGVEVKVDF